MNVHRSSGQLGFWWRACRNAAPEVAIMGILLMSIVLTDGFSDADEKWKPRDISRHEVVLGNLPCEDKGEVLRREELWTLPRTT